VVAVAVVTRQQPLLLERWVAQVRNLMQATDQGVAVVAVAVVPQAAPALPEGLRVYTAVAVALAALVRAEIMLVLVGVGRPASSSSPIRRPVLLLTSGDSSLSSRGHRRLP
jgi:hypothetical protein